MTKEQFEAIKRRWKDVGPWRYETTDDMELVLHKDGMVADVFQGFHAMIIAQAPEDITALVAEVDKLRTALIIAKESVSMFVCSNFDVSDRLKKHGDRIVKRIREALGEE